MVLPMRQRAALVPLLLFALWLLTDDEFSEDGGRHHLAVLTALGRHRPCMRVYRSLLELNLLLWGGVASLWLWKRSIGKRMVWHLLFQPVDEPGKEPFLPHTLFNASYLPVEAEEVFSHDVATNDDVSEVDAHDAHYESDGEVPKPGALPKYEPPTAEHLASTALDSLILILLSLFFFTFSSAEGGAYVDGMANVSALRLAAIAAAPIFPLLLFAGAIICSVYPWRKRKHLWKLVFYTMGAPFYQVTFRDGFIGDVITSSVRPMQDTAFTLFYLLSGLRGWWKQSYGLDDADQPLEKSWILHTWIFSLCIISPLWWRFLQNLRQAYEEKKRWPYLGNAFKYFYAAEVGMYGFFHPSEKTNVVWIVCFAMATLYQIWWDIFMDWELLVIDSGRIRLRSTRIYSFDWVYWLILGVNFVLRFCWTLSFLPPTYLNSVGVVSETFKGDLLDPMIACAEIIRRTLWGFLRVELQAIKVARAKPSLRGPWSDDTMEMEMRDLSADVFDSSWKTRDSPSGILSMTKMTDLQILVELSIYAVVFSGVGMIAAAHRLTY